MSSMTWDQVIENAKNNTRSNVRYFRLKAGEKAIIRLLGNVHQYMEYSINYDNKWRFAICDLDVNNDLSITHQISPKKKFAINILNKTTKRIEVYRGSEFVFGEFAAFSHQTGKSPSSTDGALYEISIPKDGKAFHKVKFLGPDVLTENDMNFIRLNELYDLKKVFKPLDNAQLEEVLFGNGIAKPVIEQNKSKVVQKTDLNNKMMDLDF